MAKQSKIGTRYARAFFEAAGDAENAKGVASELEEFSKAIEVSKDLKLVCCSSVFGEDKRKSVVQDVARHLKLSGLTTKMLQILSESKRLAHVEEVARGLKLLALEKTGVEAIDVQSVSDLGADEKSALVERFKKVIGKPVEANFQKVPALLGGVRVTAGGTTYDGTLSTRLAALKEQLLGGE